MLPPWQRGVMLASTRSPQMRALPIFPRRSLALALPAFFSPSILFVVLISTDLLRVAAPPDASVPALFYSLPPLGLLVCGWAIWVAPVAPQIKFLALTIAVGAMVVQFAMLLGLMVA